MPDTDTPVDADRADEAARPTVSDAIRSTESYETEEGVVFCDVETPLAWLQTGHAIDRDSAA